MVFYKTKNKSAEWIIYNRGEPSEFSKCSKCGKRQEPLMMIYGTIYAPFCMGCHREMIGKIDAKEIK